MFVIDASALAKAFLDEPRSEELRTWLAAAVASQEAIHAPALLASELGRVIQKEMGLSTAEQTELWEAALLGVELDAPVIDPDIWATAGTGLSFYDAEYVHLARRRGATLVTADRQQAGAARQIGLGVLDFVPPPNA